MDAQRGSGALITVIILLLTGTLLLNATRRQLSDSLSLVNDERFYIQQYARAASALAWGERLTWTGEAGWRCQIQQNYGWRACVLSQPTGALLRGDSGSGTLSLFRWVSHQPGGSVRAVPHGWLDYCPLPDRYGCDDGRS